MRVRFTKYFSGRTPRALCKSPEIVFFKRTRVGHPRFLERRGAWPRWTRCRSMVACACSMVPFLFICPQIKGTKLFQQHNFEKPAKKLIEQDFAGSGIDVVKLHKRHGYVDRQKASAIKFVMSLEEGEKPSLSSASAVILSEDTQDELLLSMSGPVHR